MKSQLSSLLALAVATTTLAQFTVQSDPFQLILLSSNSTLNGSALYACHEGAAIEGLCPSYSLHLGTTGASTYMFNTSQYDQPPTVNSTGILSWELSGSGFNISEPMALATNPASNVAVPLFSPSSSPYTLVGFDEGGQMNIHSAVDDTVTPLDGGIGEDRAYYRWYVCETYVGYDYFTLAWGLGKVEPQNPSCQGVGVVRVFV